MKKIMNKSIIVMCNAVAALTFFAATSPVFGNIIGTDVINGDGTVTYSYLVDNSSGRFDIAAWSLEFGFSTPDWNQLDVFSGGEVTVPNLEWFADAGIPTTGLSDQDFISLDSSGDVAVGTNLTGFSFTSSFLPGEISFDEFSADGSSVTGTTIGPVSSVPEGNGPLEAIAFAALAGYGAISRISRDKNTVSTVS